MGASWNITKHVKAYCILFLLLGNGHARRLPVARLLPVLRVLGSDAAADVLPDRRLGRPAARVRGDQVLPVHAARQRADADRHPDAVLQQRPRAALRPSSSSQTHVASSLEEANRLAAQFDENDVGVEGVKDHTFNILALQQIGQLRNSPFNQEAALGQIAAMVGVPVVVHRLCNQGAGRAGAHLAARCPRRSAHADLDDPGRRAPEDGRLRHHPHLLSDLSRRRLRAGVLRLRRRRDQHGLRRLCRDGSERLQAARRLQLRQPHGLRRAGHGRLERVPRTTRATPTTGRWA